MADQRNNNVGLLRLAFASLVIVGHAPEIADGDRAREPLTRLLHGLSLGELSVDAFFLLSGWLVAGSMMRCDRWSDFMIRRIARIVPAFVVAYLATVYLVAPLGGGDPAALGARAILPLLSLHAPPRIPGLFATLPYPDPNAAMWTISHELRCYVIVMALGMTGMLARRLPTVLLWSVLWISLLASVASGWQQASASAVRSSAMEGLLGDPAQALRLSCAFLTGTVAFLYRDALARRVTPGTALAAGLVAIAALAVLRDLAEPVLLVAGGLALYWLAFHARLGALGAVNRDWDISYGTYLYGWPTLELLFWRWPGLSPWVAATAALAGSWAAGAASWWAVERPARDLFRHRRAADPAMIALPA